MYFFASHVTKWSNNFQNIIWDKVFKSGLNKFCGRQPLKILKSPVLNTLPYMQLWSIHAISKCFVDSGPHGSYRGNNCLGALALFGLRVCVCVSVYVCVGGVTVACGLCPKSRGKLVSFSDTLLVVSILDIVYDCHLRSLLQSWRG